MREADVLARVARLGLDDDAVVGNAHFAGDGGEDDGLGLREEALCESARVAGEDEVGGEAVEVELGGVGGDAGVEAAEAEDCVCEEEGHVHAVVVVDEGGVFVDVR